MSFFDDFLLLVSFAERQRCICLGWETVDSKCITEYYRRNLTIPTPKKDQDYDNTLIPLQEWQHFIEKAYQKFIEIEPKEYIRQAIQYTIYREGRTVENSFLTLYSALETLLYFCRKDPILPSGQWPQLCKDLRKWLKKHPFLNDDKDKRKLIYEKIPELNRVSFASAFKELCDSYPVQLEDLWPILEKTKGPSLYEIRNKLVHGETFFNPLQQRALMTAEKHLRWTAERLILSILGWDISVSNVSKDFLQNMTCYIGWEADQQSFSK